MRTVLPSVVIAAGLMSAGCGDVLTQDRSSTLLVIELLEAAPGTSTAFSTTLQSDVVSATSDGAPTVASDMGRVTLRSIMKDVLASPSSVNAVTIDRYRVSFRRSDGRNSPGVDVPLPFESAISFTVPAGGTAAARTFELVPRGVKSEAPLSALASGLLIVSTIADVTFFGRDLAGNALSATGSIGVQFGNF
jgi:hypothetical protein